MWSASERRNALRVAVVAFEILGKNARYTDASSSMLQCRRERAREQKQIEGDTCIIRWLVAVSVACTAIRQIWVICDKSSALGCHLRVRTHGNQGARSSTHSLIVINSHPDMLVLPTALAQPRNQRMQVRASRNADRKSNP